MKSVDLTWVASYDYLLKNPLNNQDNCPVYCLYQEELLLFYFLGDSSKRTLGGVSEGWMNMEGTGMLSWFQLQRAPEA